MYTDVVVLTYQPPDIPTYTYKIPKEIEKEIKVGQLVSVPFGKRTPEGIIIGIQPQPVIPANAGIQKQTEKWILDQVEKDKAKYKKIEFKPIQSIVLKQPVLLPYQIELLEWMANYYHAPMVNCLEAMLPEIPKRHLAQHPWGAQTEQTIVLVPNINRIAQTMAKFPQAKNYVINHNELKTSERFAVWQKILSGNVDFIFGSRSAIFSPCPNLKKIIIYDEHDNAYHDERSPYYKTLTIAEKLQQKTLCQLEIIDPSPRITTFFVYQNILKPLQGKQVQNDKSVKVQIVNMLAEKAAGNRSHLSQILEEYIRKGTRRKKKILLFLNKKSESGHVYCRNCKFSDFAQKLPEVCPNCQSTDIFFNSLNIDSLKSLVGKIVPAANIDIATAAVLYSQKSSAYKLTPQKYDLVAHVRTDSLLKITDFTSAEKLFAQITNLKKITRGLLLLQTYNPQDPTILDAAAGNYQEFFQSQIAQRKALSYPPFALLIKLSLKGKSNESLEQKSQQLFDNLSNNLQTTNDQPLTILGPYKSFLSTNNSRYNIVLKLPVASYSLKNREMALEKVREVLKIPRDWQIEVEPDTLN